MKYHTSTTQFNCGIDLHARQMYVCVLDRDGKKLVHTNIKNNDFAYFLKLVAPYRHDLTVCAECMFGWYWLADACADAGIHFVLAHALYLKIKGLRGAKLGNPYLRWAFGEAAVVAKRDPLVIGPLAQRLEARLNNKFKANTVLAIKLARAVYFMLKQKTVFDPERLVAALSKN